MVSKSESNLLRLIGDIYDCAIDPSRWTSTLEKIAGVTEGSSVALTLNNFHEPGFDVRASWNVDAAFEAAMLANYSINPLVPMIWYLGECEAFSVLGAMPEAEYKATTFYRNTMEVFGVRDSAVGVLAKNTGHFGSISIQRTMDQPPFSQGDMAVVGALLPHLRRTVMITELLDARTIERNQLAEALDLISVAVVLVEADGGVVYANRRAEKIIEEGKAVLTMNGRLVAKSRQSATDLEAAISSAACGVSLDTTSVQHAIFLESIEGHDLIAWVLPLDTGLRRDLGAGTSGKVAIFIRKFGQTETLPGEIFVRRYGITPAECRVLMLIVQGMNVSEIADVLGISAGTVKTHLKHLFSKTSTSRQSDLIRLAVSALAPASTT